MTELLAPSGNYESAVAAIYAGADAVYLGYSAFSARQSAQNFTTEELEKIVRLAHLFDVKIYVAMNTLIKDDELTDFLKTLLSVWSLGVDAIIMQDIFLGKYVHENYPEIVLHLSTQAGVSSVFGAKLAKSYGFSRVILARETPFDEIREITKIIETEVFIQGALCTAFSGQCYFSSFAGGNSGNRGRCKQPCRKLYTVSRNGTLDKRYALSLSDLCVGTDITKLQEAGVCSFKIEGRMRRKEYIVAAVNYYRAILDHKDEKETQKAFSDLKRTYNRGNYTKGLSFGQDKRLLSTSVQGHLGEQVGFVKVENGQYFVESNQSFSVGDAFKILRSGKEVGGGVFEKNARHGFIIKSFERLHTGDTVFITTDARLNERLNQVKKEKVLTVSLHFEVGKPPVATCGEFVYEGKDKTDEAKNAPLTEQELRSCFEKTDDLPIKVQFSSIELIGNMFMPKSALNAFRRTFFKEYLSSLTKKHTVYDYKEFSTAELSNGNDKTALISDTPNRNFKNVFIYKPSDYTKEFVRISNAEEVYLYVPTLLFGNWISKAVEATRKGIFDGLYFENYAGLQVGKEYGVPVFAGTGFNITNRLSLSELLKENPTYYCLSKELTLAEQTKLSSPKSFALSYGDIKLMDLSYCPFGKTCTGCDKKACYSLTDENGRAFPLRRYVSFDGVCRFEVYNYATLIGEHASNCGVMADFSVSQNKLPDFADIEVQKKIVENYTYGHKNKSIL